MTCLKRDQIGNKRLSRVIANYERPGYKKIRLNFHETLCCPFTLRCRHRSALRNVLGKRSSYDVFLHHDFNSGSSLQRNVTSSVGCRSESKERRQSSGSADRISKAPETKGQSIDSWPFPFT